MTTHDDLLDELRPRAFAIAYRMLGSVTEAEDVVQEALLRLHLALEGGDEIASPRAYVATVTTRLAINELRSARARREHYVGEWLPEPVLAEGKDQPEERAELADSLSLALLLVLERLTPEQRAAWLLREVFHFDYPRIGEILGKCPDTVRQVVARARRQVGERRRRFPATRARRVELADQFVRAVEAGDLDGLVALLTRDVVLVTDGGGKRSALPRPMHGRDRVARAVLSWARAVRRGVADARLRPVEVNGEPGGLLLTPGGEVAAVFVLEPGEDGIGAVRGVVNPDKLRHLGPDGATGALGRP